LKIVTKEIIFPVNFTASKNEIFISKRRTSREFSPNIGLSHIKGISDFNDKGQNRSPLQIIVLKETRMKKKDI
jgi:hypothetical protein